MENHKNTGQGTGQQSSRQGTGQQSSQDNSGGRLSPNSKAILDVLDAIRASEARIIDTIKKNPF